MPNHGTFNVEISLAKGIIFTKIGLANGTFLKLWAAHPYPKFSKEPPPPPPRVPSPYTVAAYANFSSPRTTCQQIAP